eukprot:TRINITY_DN161_c0_g1_i2.p1 TRINITY_DN161_c0_g1~~TRINITY_DN161_c0_g1_i2.p1  ORF type:complete len:226 (-),score=55.23 TRINITY_DN161_c0_g1_i2:111-788(-)
MTFFVFEEVGVHLLKKCGRLPNVRPHISFPKSAKFAGLPHRHFIFCSLPCYQKHKETCRPSSQIANDRPIASSSSFISVSCSSSSSTCSPSLLSASSSSPILPPTQLNSPSSSPSSLSSSAPSSSSTTTSSSSSSSSSTTTTPSICASDDSRLSDLQRQKLASNPDILALLRDKRLQRLIREIDSSSNRPETLQQYLSSNQDLTQFVNLVVQTINPAHLQSSTES